MNLYDILIDQKFELDNLDLSLLCDRREERDFDLDSKFAQIVIGVRRSGKSTLCQKVLLQSGVRFAYVNFDDEQLVSIKAEGLNEVLETLYRIYGDFTHLFMDEIQNVEGWPLFVNRLLRQGVRLVLTGSNANLLSGELATHLTGRYNQIELYPFSFSEYCSLNSIDTVSKTTKARALRTGAFDRYLLEGGFPELVTVSNRQKYTSSLLNAIISKDICKRYKVRYKKTLTAMANGMLDRYCQEISFNHLAEKYQLNSVHTARNYADYLTNAYLLCSVPKFSFKSIERQVGRKFYAVDMAFVTTHDDVLQTEGYGWRLENVVAVELLRRYCNEFQQLFYLRKDNEFEVDFVLTENGHVKELIQVAYDFTNPSQKLYRREVGGLLKGSKMTNCDKLTLVALKVPSETIDVEGKKIRCVPAVEWLLGE